jgi:hypothetical protein
MVLPPKSLGQQTPFKAFTNITAIDFDDVPDEKVIDTHYASKGVTFASITTYPTRQWNAYARKDPNAVTLPNVISVLRKGLVEFDALEGGIQAIFHKPQRFVGITARATVIDEIINNYPTAKPFLEFYNAKGGQFMPVTQYYPFVYGDPNWGSKQRLSYLAPNAEIGKVVFSCQIGAPHRVYGLFDHLVFCEEIPYTAPIPLGAEALLGN